MTNETLIAFLKNTGAIKTTAVENAFRAVDRAQFVPEELKSDAYADAPLPIGTGQTISQPTVVAFCLEWLRVRPDDRVLDVGSGSGWTTALLAHLVESAGSVIGVERIPELVSFGSKNLEKYKFANAHIEQSGKNLGKPKAAPFDRILVSAAADEISDALVKQLKDDGRMVVPVRNAIYVVDRFNGRSRAVCHEGFVFVPLVA